MIFKNRSKILAKTTKNKYIIVATAPSMDGYASATSSMDRDGLKISLPSKCPDIIIGDTDILKTAPTEMLRAGLGDMLAKYISIAEWRISNLINGEYYCEDIAEQVRFALKKCVDNADKLLERDEKAVEAVFDGLILAGEAMQKTGLSRPASGMEHYFSHIWDMRGLEYGTKTAFHGIQCAIGTLYAVKIYNKLLSIKPDRKKALKFASEFDYSAWSDVLRRYIGKGAEVMIEAERKERKYDLKRHAARLEMIINKWEEVISIIKAEVPTEKQIIEIINKTGLPKDEKEIGIDCDIKTVFKSTKDIRDKYVCSTLCWDLGIIDEMANCLTE